MSHLRPESRGRHKISQCRKGRHLYGASQDVGAGILRQVCEVCGDVTIDLSGAETTRQPVLAHRPSFSNFSR